MALVFQRLLKPDDSGVRVSDFVSRFMFLMSRAAPTLESSKARQAWCNDDTCNFCERGEAAVITICATVIHALSQPQTLLLPSKCEGSGFRF